MKTRNWRNGTSRCRSYIKPAGNGYEVGLVKGSKLLFVGNFIHSSEANRWYTTMNRQISHFGRSFRVAKQYPTALMWRFLTNSLYRQYYRYLDNQLPTHNRNFQKAVTRDVRTYKRVKARAQGKQTIPFLKAV